jgi:dTDP-4-dehydrorhamnose reductase
MKLGLIGANGNVGTELSFLLKNDVNLIPIMRNKLGALFLTHHKFPCRIFDISKENDALESLYDLDSVIICSNAVDSYSGSQTRSSRKINEDIIKNTTKFTKDNATLFFFSTIRSFSNDIVPNTSNFGIKSSFEKEKIHLEKLLLSESKKNNKRAFIFRMSQIFGENQPRTNYFRKSLSSDKVHVQVSPEKMSNIVHILTIKDAIMKCLKNQYSTGIYSLVNNPQWTWKNVIDYYKKSETTIEYESKITPQNETQPFNKNTNGFFWNLLKSNKKYIKPFLYYASTKFEPQIKKKLAEKKMLNAISTINNSLESQLDMNKKLKLLQTQRYENVKEYFDKLINNNKSYKIPEGLTKLKIINKFNIEEFSFNPIPGPFLDGLTNTQKLLDNHSENIFFKYS